jgi:hypothetical protein
MPRHVIAGSGPGLCLRFENESEMRAAFVASGFSLESEVRDKGGNIIEAGQTWLSLGRQFYWPGVGDVYIAGEFGALMGVASGDPVEISPALEGWHVNIWPGVL